MFSFLFTFWRFYWHFFKLINSLLGHVQSIDEPIKGILHFCYGVLISSISFGFFRRVLIPLLTVPICACMVSMSSIGSFSILIIVVLKSSSDNSRIFAISESCFDACSASLNSIFCLLVWLVIFCCKLDMICWIEGTEMSRLLLWDFIFTWLEVRLCVLFAVAVGVWG